MEILIHKYLRGEATEEERQRVEVWKLESDDNQIMFDEIKMIWDHSNSTPFEMSELEKQHELQRFQRKLAERHFQEQKTNIKRHKVFKLSTIAATISLLIIASVIGFALYMVYAISAQRILIGQHSSVCLPDSSEVFTNNESTVAFRQTLIAREARLVGEAFFEVQPNEKRPFWVYTNAASIKVLGTSFLVKAYPEQAPEIMVVSGRVQVQHLDNEYFLQAGEQIKLMPDGEILFNENINPNILAWKTGVLEFDHTSLTEVLTTLENLHGVSFELLDPDIENLNFLGTIEKLSLENTLKLLSDTYGFSIEYVSTTHIRISYKELE